MHIRSAIEQLGYSPHESRVYLAALELGESTVTEIAEKAHIPRTTANLIINSLHRKGLMNSYLIRRRKIWTAENPEKLMTHAKESEEAMKIALPELQSIRHDISAKPTIRTYEGAEEIRQIMNDILETKHNVLAIFSWDDWVALLGQAYMDNFIESRVKQHLHIKVLTPKTKTAHKLKETDVKELRVTQFLPNSLAIRNSNFIYGNKVAIISVRSKRPTGILIEDKDTHHMMEVLFESLWKRSGGG